MDRTAYAALVEAAAREVVAAGRSVVAWQEAARAMLLPRLAAVAEVAWTPQPARDWTAFAARVRETALLWHRAGQPWHRSPGVTWDD